MAVYNHYPNQDKRYVVVYPDKTKDDGSVELGCTVTLYEGSIEYDLMMEEGARGTASINEIDDS